MLVFVCFLATIFHSTAMTFRTVLPGSFKKKSCRQAPKNDALFGAKRTNIIST